MPPPYGVSQECWDNNVRLMRDEEQKSTVSQPSRSSSLRNSVNQGRTPKDRHQARNSRSFNHVTTSTSTNTNHHTIPSATPAQLAAEEHGIQYRDRWLLNQQSGFGAQPRPADNILSQYSAENMGQQTSRTPFGYPTPRAPGKYYLESAVEQPSVHASMNTSNIDLIEPAEPLTYYTRRGSHSEGQIKSKSCPEYISTSLPPWQKPRDPHRTSQLLQLARCEIFFVEFGCECHCRNLGTCIHYQIAFNRSKLPDGLICQLCTDAPQKMITARRKCPEHQDDSGMESNHIASRTEDFLPTDEQKERYRELLEKHMTGDWEGDQSMSEVRRGKRPARAPVILQRVGTLPIIQQSVGGQEGQINATPRVVPASGLAMPRTTVKPQPDNCPQVTEESRQVPNPGVPDEAHQAQRGWSQLQDTSSPPFFDPSTSVQHTQNEFDDSGFGWMQQSGMGAKGEAGSKEMQTADLRTIETGGTFKLEDLKDFEALFGG